MSDPAQLLVEHLDIWTGAVERKNGAGRGNGGKFRLYGIEKLRALIFDLAAEGRFIPSSSAKKIKLSSLADFVMGQAPPGSECNKDGVGTVFVKTGEFGELYPEIVEWTTKPLKLAQVGDVLICVVGATIGKLNLAIDCAIGRSVAAIRPHAGLHTRYLYYSLMPFTLRLRRNARGSAQGVIGKDDLAGVEILAASPGDQERIVAKLDELMALCDALEAGTREAMSAHEKLVRELLATLVNSKDADDLAANWSRIEANFDTFFTTEESIETLKQTILELAIRGKLAPQIPSNESAEKLLLAIKEHRDQRQPRARGQALAASAPVSEGEKPFALPSGWAFVRFVDVLINRDAERVPISSDEREKRKGEYPYYGASGIIDAIDDYIFEEDLLLIGEDGANLINRSTPIAFIASGKYWVNNHAHVLQSMSADLLRYMEIYINAIDLKPYVTGTAQPKMNQAKMNSIVVALPPASELSRIVAKVDDLVRLCDALRNCIADARSPRIAFTDAVIERQVA